MTTLKQLQALVDAGDKATHQSKLHPYDNKFHRGNGGDQKHYWLTPPKLYAELDAEHNFDFDPCPYPLPDGFDGLTCEWGKSSYVNPPFGSIMHQGPNDKKPKKKGPTAWARKAMEEQAKGKDVVIVYPMDKWVLMLIEAGAEITSLGDVKWVATEDGSAGKGTGRWIAKFFLKGKDSRPAIKSAIAEIEAKDKEIERLREALDSIAWQNGESWSQQVAKQALGACETTERSEDNDE